jgi:Tfp pilus assembly protein PilW
LDFVEGARLSGVIASFKLVAVGSAFWAERQLRRKTVIK